MASFAWLALVVVGVFFLGRFSSTPGREGQIATKWPRDSQLLADGKLPKLVMFAHPHCQCSKASVRELEQLMPYLKGKLQVHIVFIQPQGRDDQWVQSKLWKHAVKIPGVKVSVDIDSQETDRFGVQTSGHTLLYDYMGDLLFSGGVTPARGHMGENLGSLYLRKWAEGDPQSPQVSKIFGCALQESESVASAGGLE